MPVIAPSPFVGEGCTGISPAFALVRGCQPERTPHPASLREATFSYKGRREEERLPYRGAMRMAPSRRMVSPFSIGFSTM
jgi:hypothetical protein